MIVWQDFRIPFLQTLQKLQSKYTNRAFSGEDPGLLPSIFGRWPPSFDGQPYYHENNNNQTTYRHMKTIELNRLQIESASLLLSLSIAQNSP